MADIKQSDHEKVAAAQRDLIAAQGEFDAAMCACRSSPTAENRTKVQDARNRIDEAIEYLALLDRLFEPTRRPMSG